MSALAHIGRGLEKKLITAVVRPGDGQRLLELLAEAPGVLSISQHHARGVGNRRVRQGQLFFSEKEVLIVLAEAEHADTIFAALFEGGRIGEPGVGIIFMERVLRGHPMLLFDGADW